MAHRTPQRRVSEGRTFLATVFANLRFLYRKRALITSAFLVALQVMFPIGTIAVYAAASPVSQAGSSASLDPVANKATRLQTQGSSGVDQSSGALTYSYPFSLPPGRNNVVPNLVLSYNSQNNDTGWFGYGWNISIPYIERVNKGGSDKLYSESNFVSSLHGELTTQNGSAYEQKIDDGSYAKYTFNGTSWQMTDRDGTTYYFGNTSTSKIEDTTGAKIGRWYITSTRDKFGNGITYSYTKDSGTVYPSSISYTEHALAHPLNLITFNLESKSDQTVSYKYGFKITDTKRVNNIKVATNGYDIAYFSFTYATGANNTRSLLESIEEKRLGSTGDWTTIPKTYFEYEKSAATFSGTISRSTSPYGSNVVIDSNNNGVPELYNAGDGYFPIDINGDFKKDLAQSDRLYGSAASYLRINYKYNRNSSFDLRNMVYTSTPWSVSFYTGQPMPPIRSMVDPVTTWTNQASVADINGDGFDDVLYTDPKGGSSVGINTSQNTFNYASSSSFSINTANDQSVDINNDGLLDKVSKTTSATSTLFYVYLNNGTGYLSSPDFMYDAKIASTAFDIGVRFIDINNDGLIDVVRGYDSQYSSGAGATCTEAYSAVPSPAPINQTVNEIYLNTGTQFAYSSSTLPGYLVSYSNCSYGFTNGYLVSKSTTEYDSNGNLSTDFDGATNLTAKQDVLKKVTSSLSSTLDVSYTWSTASSTANPNLPIPMYVVGTTTEKQKLLDSDPHIVTYTFANGLMYFDENNPKDHRFASFGRVDVVDGKTKTTTYFHQGNGDDYTTGESGDSFYNIGRAYRTDTFDIAASPALLSKNLSLYKTYSYASSSFTYLDSQVTSTYTSSSTWVSQATKQVYNESKRLIKTSIDYGDIEPFISFASSTVSDKGIDILTTAYQYSNVRPQRLVRETTTDYAGAVVSNKTYYYDNLPFTLVDKGALTATYSAIYNNDGTINATSSDTTTYDATGNVTQLKDSLNRITTISYDSGYFFPTSKIDPLNGTTTLTYDDKTLNLVSSTGPDGISNRQEIDGFGKVRRTYTTNTAGGISNDTKINYSYGGGVQVYTEKKGSSGVSSRSLQVYDSYGRLIQTKQETSLDSYLTQDTAYDAKGNIVRSSLPYTSTGFGLTDSAPSNGNIIYTYDALNRVTTKSAAGLITTYSYGARSLTVSDNASTQHKKDYLYDARGNLTQVNEYNGGNTYTTSYSYTPSNKLSRITDANGNIRNFSYLSNGLLTYQEDPHPTTDTTFTTYSYTYDVLGRLMKKTGPLGNITYSYDSLDRPTARVVTDANYPTSTTTIAYTGCSNNYRLPCVIDRGTSSTTIAYNIDNRIQSETMRIDGNTFTRSYAYDSFANPTTITYPDGGQAVYTYTLDNKQSSITYITPGGQTKVVARDALFNSQGALTSLTFGNNVYQCNTYTTSSTDGAIVPRLSKTTYLFNTLGCDSVQPNKIELYKDEIAYKDSFTPSSVLSTYRDIAGTVHTKSDTFTYDNLARLTQVTTSYNGGASSVDTLVYDPIGNLLSENDVLYKYSKEGMQNAHAATIIGGTNIEYDKQGNRISVGADKYSWNFLNQLVQASTTNGLETYTYDENGERIKRVVQATVAVNQKVTPATAPNVLTMYRQGDMFATSTATTTTVIATSTYNTLSSISLLSYSSLYSLVYTYYSSPFTAQYCGSYTNQSARSACVASTTEQLVANDISTNHASTTITKGLINDVLQIAKGVYQIPETYTGLPTATTTIATSSSVPFVTDNSLLSSYNTFVATGIVTPISEFTSLPLVSTSTYQTLVDLGIADTGKVKTLLSYAGCNATTTPCTTPLKVVFERYYKNNGKLLSNKDLNEMWYVYASRARVPSSSTEYGTSTVLSGLSNPTISNITTTTATSTYYSSLYFASEYEAQLAVEPRFLHFNTIPYLVTQSTFADLQTAGVNQTSLENYTVLIRELLNIPTASSTEYMYALKQFVYYDKGATLSDAVTKEMYMAMLGAAYIPNDLSAYTANTTFDVSQYLVINSYRTVNSSFTLQWTTACNGGYIPYTAHSRCVIGTSPFTLPVSTSTTVSYILSVSNGPHPTQTALLMGPSTNTTAGTDSHNYGTDLPNIFISYYTQILSTDGFRIDADVTPTIVTQQASSSSPLKIIINNDSQWSSSPYDWEAQSVTLKAYANTPQLTLASTTLLSFATTTAATSSLTTILAAAINHYGEIYDSSDSITIDSTATTTATSSLSYISPESYVEFASTTLRTANDISKVFLSTSTPQCVSNASTTECDKQARITAFRQTVGYLSGFIPSLAATEEFWMIHKGKLQLPSTSATSSAVNIQNVATSTARVYTYDQLSTAMDAGTLATSTYVTGCSSSVNYNPYSSPRWNDKCFLPISLLSNFYESAYATSTLYLPATITIPNSGGNTVVASNFKAGILYQNNYFPNTGSSSPLLLTLQQASTTRSGTLAFNMTDVAKKIQKGEIEVPTIVLYVDTTSPSTAGPLYDLSVAVTGQITIESQTKSFSRSSLSGSLATSTATTTVNLSLVPPGLLTDQQFNSLYTSSSFALATSTKIVSKETYNELLYTPVRIKSDVTTIFDYALPFATSSCPGEAATSTCVVAAQKTKVKDTIGSMSGFLLSAAALEELKRVNTGDLNIVPVNLYNASTTESSQTVTIPMDVTKSFTTYSTSSSVSSQSNGTCSFGQTVSTSSQCYIVLPYINSPASNLKVSYDFATTSVATSTLLASVTYLVPSGTSTATTSLTFTEITATSTITGVKASSTVTFDITSPYQTALANLSGKLTLIPNLVSTSTIYTVSNPTITVTRNVLTPNINYNEFGTYVAGTTTYTSLVATTSLQGYYKLNEASGNASDESGNNKTLTNTGSTAFSTGKLGSGAVFNTTNRRLSTTDALGFNGADSSNTWSFWVNMSSNTGYLLDNVIANKMRLIVYANGSGVTMYLVSTSNPAGTVSSSAMSNGTFYHVAVVNNAGTFTLYLNGVSQGSTGALSNGTATGGSTYFAIGAAGDSWGANSNSTIDEVGTWSRALSSTEIANLYNSGTGITHPFTVASSSPAQLVYGLNAASPVPLNRSEISSYATSTATTTILYSGTSTLQFSMRFLSPIGPIPIGSTTTVTTSSVVATTSLQGYYKLDESSGNAADATGNGNTLTNTGTVGYSTGKINSGAVFNNTGSKHLKVESALGLTGSNSATANFWVKPSAITGYAFDWYTQSGGNRRYIIYFDGGAGKFRTYFSPNDNAAFGPVLTTGNWYMVTLVITSGSTFELFVNGTSYGQVGSIASSGSAINRFSLGGAGDSDGAPANATFDEVGVWSRALTSTEITSLYNSGSALAHPFTTSSSTTTTSTSSAVYAYAPNNGSNNVIDVDYNSLPTNPSYATLGALSSYPFASSTATSTIHNFTAATTSSQTIYTPFSGYSSASSTVTTYLTLNGVLVGTYTYEKGQEASTGKLTYVLTNYLGTPVLQTDVNGDIVEMDVTDVFGNYVHRDQRNDNAYHNKGYTGHEFDDVTGLTYSHARYLDTKAHTFLSVDPMLYKLPESYLIDPQQMNSYAYARNNPIIYTDPDGKAIWIPAIIWGATIINFFIQSTDVAKAPANQTQAQGTSLTDLGLDRAKAASNYATVALTFGAGAAAIASGLKNVGTTANSTATTISTNSFTRGVVNDARGSTVLNNVTIESNIRGNVTTYVSGGVRDLRGDLQTLKSNPNSLLRSSNNNPTGTYSNRSNPQLPEKPTGYYSEYNTLPQSYHINGKTPPERFIMGKEGEIFYSPDHYKTFYQLE